MAWNLCLDLNKDDGPLNHMSKLMEKTKAMPPEEWSSGYDWDFKPIPPEIDFIEVGEDDESDEDGDAK